MRQSGRVDGVKLERPHSPGCFCEEGNDERAFSVQPWNERQPPAHERLDKLGRNNGRSWTWERFLCNDPDCEATVLIRSDLLARFVTEKAWEAERRA